MTARTRSVAAVLGIALALLAGAHGTAGAGNGFFITTYGGRYQGLGGTYSTFGGSVMSVQSNPATLLDLKNNQLEIGSAQIFGTLHYNDRFQSLDHINSELSFDNSEESHTFAAIPYFGFAQPLNERMAWGVAGYAQAGGGVDINSVVSVLPLELGRPAPLVMTKTLRDQYQGAMFFKVTPAFAMAFEDLRIGAGLDLVYGDLTNKITFYSMDRTRVLLRDDYQGDPKFAVGGKVGLTYTWKEITAGYTYMLKNSFDFDGAFTETDIAGKQTVADVTNNLTLPDRHTIGASFAHGPWTVACDGNFMRYGAYFDHRRLTLSEPLFPGGAVVSDELINYQDQWIVNAGAEYRRGRVSYRTGWNYGRSPIQEYAVSPQDNLIAEHHAQIGVGIDTKRFTYSVALERAFMNSEKGDFDSVWGKQRFFSKTDTYKVDLQQYLFYFSVACKL